MGLKFDVPSVGAFHRSTSILDTEATEEPNSIASRSVGCESIAVRKD